VTLTVDNQPIDPEQPLPQILQLVRNNLLLLLASQYNAYLIKERDQRRANEEKDPSLVSDALCINAVT
jgi:hypothetical protein